MNFIKTSLVALAASASLAAAVAPAHAAATIQITSRDPAGVGFNDPTPVAPVGGNPGTTLGEQRMLAAAGGTTPTGDDVLIVTGQRDGKPFRKVIDIPALFLNAKTDDDIVLAGGDTLYVNKAPMDQVGPAVARDAEVAQAAGLQPAAYAAHP